MENLIISKTNYTPDINFNADTRILNISGKSYPENTFEFYAPITSWITECLKSRNNEKLIFNFELTYINSGSLKSYFDILDILEEANNDGTNIEINWIYEADDDIIEETGEDFKEDFESLVFNLIAK
jgi:hypothetical protein